MTSLLNNKFSFPEVIVSNNSVKKIVHSGYSSGKLRKIASRLYTTNLHDSPETIVKRYLWQIVGQYFPSAILACRTAIENKPGSDGNIYVISNKVRKVTLPGGITIYISSKRQVTP